MIAPIENDEPGDEEVPRWAPMAALVATGHSIKDAAEATGWKLRTAHHYSRRPEFRREVSLRRAQLVDSCYAKVRAEMTKTIDKLCEHRDSNDRQVSLSACKTLVGMLSKDADRVAEALERDILVLERQIALRTKLDGADSTTDEVLGVVNNMLDAAEHELTRTLPRAQVMDAISKAYQLAEHAGTTAAK